MREKKLRVEINRPLNDVFSFVLNPNNTPLWIDSVVKEETNEWPVKVGTTYRNCGVDGVWNDYTLAEITPNNTFVLRKNDNNYSVRYTLKAQSNGFTELEYYEWVEVGELADPFTQEILEKLKLVMEHS